LGVAAHVLFVPGAKVAKGGGADSIVVSKHVCKMALLFEAERNRHLFHAREFPQQAESEAEPKIIQPVLQAFAKDFASVAPHLTPGDFDHFTKRRGPVFRLVSKGFPRG